jgi:hypothetical protein
MMSLPALAPSVILSVVLFLHINSPAFGQPSISEPSLTAELVLHGLLSPTSIAFLNENNILLLEKKGGSDSSRMVNCNLNPCCS